MAPEQQEGPPVTTVVAIDNDKSSQCAVKWAIDNLSSHSSEFILLHIKTLDAQTYDSKGVPTKGLPPRANDLRWTFLPFRGYCARKRVKAKEVVRHDLFVDSAILDYINQNAVSNIVVGASNRITKKLKSTDVPSCLYKSAPDFCSVYIVGRGKLQYSRHATRSVDIRTFSTMSRSSDPHLGRSSSRGSRSSIVSDSSFERSSDFVNSGPCQAFTIGRSKDSSKEKLGVSGKLCHQDPPSTYSYTSPLSFQSSNGPYSECSGISVTSDGSSRSSSSNYSSECNAEMGRSKLHLNKTKDTCEEAFSQEEAVETVKKAQQVEQNQKRSGRLASISRHRIYDITDIELATDCFSLSLKIGEGGYGPVYKGRLDQTPVAIKVLRPDAAQGKQQFEKEVEVLSCMRHPHMVLLLGACPEYGCLVYEYMDYGNLEERLFRKDDTPSIPWQARFKIATEIASALLFLHQSKPEALVHRDLKPANILLDRNYVSKIGDVGLARLVPATLVDSITQYHITSAAGTFCYIDPEYQQTGKLCVKSDIYSVGVMLLQILTAMPPMGLTHKVGSAIEKGKFAEILDETVTDWPIEDALSLANIALKCCELRKKDRPDLGSVVLPELLRLSNPAVE